MKTLLQEFIRQERGAYTEPSRKGIKGNPRGRISAQKNEAALLMLTSDAQVAIAKKVGVSPGLLLKWRTEEAFRERVAYYIHKFILVFIEHILQISQKFSPDSIPADTLVEFEDVSSYSDTLNVNIFAHVFAIPDAEEFINRGWPIFLIFKDALFAPLSDKLYKTLSIYVLELRLELLGYIREQLASPKMSEKAKIFIRVFLKELIATQKKLYSELHTPEGTDEAAMIFDQNCWLTSLQWLVGRRFGRFKFPSEASWYGSIERD